MLKLKEPRVVTDMGDGGSTTDDDHISDEEVPSFMGDNQLEEEMPNLHYSAEDWQSGPVHEMNELLKKSLREMFLSAIDKLVDQGFSRGNSTRAIIHTGIPPGWGDCVSSIVDGAIKYLNRPEYSVPKYGLEDTVDLTIVRLVNRFRNVRNDYLPLYDVMWSLLMHDLNLSNACGLGENLPGASSALPNSKSDIPVTSQISGDLSNPENSMLPPVPRPATTTQESETQRLERLAELRKVATAVSRKDVHRPRYYNIERSKTLIAKVPIRAAKVSACESVVVDQSPSTQAGSSSSSESIKNNHPNSSSSSPTPVLEKEEVPTPPSPTTDYKSGIPYDDTLKKYIPQNERDEAILALLAQKEMLEKELNNWKDWTSDKVMQATRKLIQVRAEMKMLKKDREDGEKILRGRVIFEEKTFKRSKEMENALANTDAQIEINKVVVRNLEEEQNYLRMQLNKCDLESIEANERLREKKSREKEAIAKIRMADQEKGEFLDKLKDVLSEKADFHSKQRETNETLDRFTALGKQEEKENEKKRDLIASVKAKKEAEEAFQQQEVDDTKKVAEIQLKDTIKKIKKLEKSISEIQVEALKAKIDKLKIGMSGESSASRSKSVERECVMCMDDKIAVVFLPCAHQILCGECSVLHERKGMKDCPSCRTVIERRIPVIYPASN